MYKPRELGDFGQGGPAAGAALLSHAQIVPGPARVPGASAVQAARRWRASLDQRLSRIDWTPDLAEDIGSGRWFRGLGTMLALGAAALLGWPQYSALEAAPAMPLDRLAREELRSLSIQPLALGGDSGRHMGPTARVSALASAPERASIDLTTTLGQGDSLTGMLVRAGVGPDEASSIAAMIAAKVNLSDISPGTRFAVTLGQRSGPGQPRRAQKIAFRARFDLSLEVVRAASGLAVVPRPIAVDTTPLRIRGVIGSGLYRSARAAGVPIEAIEQYLQTLDAHLSLDADMQPGDTYDIVVSFRRSAAGESQVGDLQFAGLERGGQPIAQLVRWGSDGQFFEASAMGQHRTGLLMPVVGHITSGYGQRRHPILGYTRMHAGVDFGAPYGSPIYAVGDATVVFAGRHGGHGNFVKLDHGGGYGTGYGHMSRIAVGIGSHVRAGQIIGYVGSTGLSTGPHLHYELYRNGQTVNPLSVKFTVSNSVNEQELAAFRARLAALKAVTPGAAFASVASRQAPHR